MTCDFIKQKSIITLILALILCMFASTSYANRQTTDLMSSALKSKASGNIKKAINDLNKAISVSTNSSQTTLALFMLGDWQLESKRYSSARKTYKKIITSTDSPDDLAEANFGLARTEYQLGNISRSKRLCREIQKKYKKSPYAELARAFVKSKQYENKTTVVTKNIKARPKKKSIAQISHKKIGTTKKKQVTKVYKAHKKTVSPQKTPLVDKTKKSKVASFDPSTQMILQDLLFIPQASKQQKSELASQIIRDQNILKNGGSSSNMSKVLFRLATTTAFFGEHMEACKFYDEILTKYPTSSLVEDAYFEAIRLRAILRIFGSVKSWSKAFLAAFPTSNYRKQIRALVSYSNLDGKTNIRKPVSRTRTTPKKEKRNVAKSKASDVRLKMLKSEIMYKEAMRKMKEDNYNLALNDFLVLAKKYPNTPDVWWNISLIYVQLEKLPKADKSIKKMLELDPGNKDANSLLGYISYRLKKFDNAAKAYKKASENDSGSGVTFFNADKAAERMQKQ